MLQCKSSCNNSVFEIVLNFSMTGLTALLTEENMMKEIEKDTATMYQIRRRKLFLRYVKRLLISTRILIFCILINVLQSLLA